MSSIVPESRSHADCYLSDIEDHGVPCADGKPASCPAMQAAKRRADGRRDSWSQLQMYPDAGGARHHLDGEPVHCGAGLELQALEYAADDYGEYAVLQQRGVLVRYEARWVDGEPRATLHSSIAGHEFTATLQPWMHFRWPEVRPC